MRRIAAPVPMKSALKKLPGSTDLLDQRVVPLKRFVLCCYGQITVALVMGALGLVDRETVIPACYFGAISIIVAVITCENAADQRRPTADTKPNL